ncbi:sensor histidine kinase [Gordoniibacillus kamchatkensis]|uniref:sensor histidine kinase n=1 Tax=Gordoniibacillus kamchatkensis TaxID=1590651 RepID=UPI000AC713ED|nr:sensor histidine kinase [Paenibacillus sp. VKM B-2647]
MNAGIQYIRPLEKEALLKALQAQINPHFLYNTLDAINWMAIRRKADDISYMIESLSKYFRFSLKNGKDIVSLEDELSLVETYLNIQKIRFGDEFAFTIRADEAAKSLLLPKLTLQPIVENALLHGIRNLRDRKGLLEIEAAPEQEHTLLIRVTDNGIGMEEQAVKHMLQQDPAQGGAPGRRGYGLFNVQERVRLYAGANSGITVTSVVGRGTTIEVRIQLSQN